MKFGIKLLWRNELAMIPINFLRKNRLFLDKVIQYDEGTYVKYIE